MVNLYQMHKRLLIKECTNAGCWTMEFLYSRRMKRKEEGGRIGFSKNEIDKKPQS